MQPHVLHVYPSFGIGGVPLRMTRVISKLAGQYRHSIVALDANFDAAARLTGTPNVDCVEPPRVRGGLVPRLVAYRRVLAAFRPDLLLTFNWGSIEWALAHRARPRSRHIHFEAGFGKEEADRQLRRRILLRRIALSGTERVVVPSRALERLALEQWRLPASKILHLPNGVSTAPYAEAGTAPLWAVGAAALGAPIVGTVAPLRPEKNLARLLRAFSAVVLQTPAVLAIAGDGSERGPLQLLADELGIAYRVVFLGNSKPQAVLPFLDVFALSSDTEQMPNSILEAMAAGRAIAAVDVGDIGEMLAPENREYVVDRDDTAALATAIGTLLRSPGLRAELGAKNRLRAETLFSEERMIDRYRNLLRGACDAD